MPDEEFAGCPGASVSRSLHRGHYRGRLGRTPDGTKEGFCYEFLAWIHRPAPWSTARAQWGEP